MILREQNPHHVALLSYKYFVCFQYGKTALDFAESFGRKVRYRKRVATEGGGGGGVDLPVPFGPSRDSFSFFGSCSLHMFPKKQHPKVATPRQ